MHPGIFQWVKRLRNGIVLVVSLLAAVMKDPVALKSKWPTFLCSHGLIVAALCYTYYLSHGHTNVIQTLHIWLHSNRTAVEYLVDQNLPSVWKWAGSRD